MAEVITRFKLETTQYDSKLRDAAKGLTEFTHQAALAGNEFGKFTQKNVEAARALGNIGASATNAKDKVKELVGAYNDVAKAYNNLTKEQQQSDFGKAMAESMLKLKGRITEAKQEMNDTGGVLGQLASKFTVNIDALKLFNVGISAAKAALDVAKDAFFASEATVDEWGRTIQSAQGLYEGFLNAINTGDISGYLSRMDEIVRAARAAYDEMDKLGTMKTIQSPQFSKQEAENNRLRMMLMTGRYIAPGAGSGLKASMKEGQMLTPDQIKRIEGMLQNGMKTIVSLTGNELKQTGKAIDAYYDSLAKQNGMTMQEFREGTSSWASFSEKMAGYEAYKKWDREARTEFARQGGRGYVDFDKNNPYAEFRKWGTFRVDKMDKNSYNDLVGLIKQQQQQQSQMYSTLGQAYRTMNRVDGTTVRSIMGGGGGGKGGNTSAITENIPEGSVRNLTQQIQELKKAQLLVTNSDDWKNYEAQIGAITKQINLLTGKIGEVLPDDIQTNRIFLVNGTGNGLMSNATYTSDSNAKGGLKLTLDDKAMKSVMQGVQKSLPKVLTKEQKIEGMQNLLGGVNGVLSGIQQIGIEIPEEIQKVMGVLNGIMTVVTSIESIVTIGQAFGWFANGGVVRAANGAVPGNHFSGDVTPIMANAGEVVLNRAQAGVLAASLEAGNRGGGYTPSHVTGEQIWIALNAYTKRTGRGELVTWR